MDELNMQKPEVPVIIIERDNLSQDSKTAPETARPSARPSWLMRLGALAAVGCMMVAALAGHHFWNYHYNIGVSVSATPKQNISKLQKAACHEAPEVVITSDSILGVALDFFAIHALKATIEFEEPDTADTSVYLYCRSVDHKADSTYIGSLVVDGKEYQSDDSRLGYMAMLGTASVVGISRSERVKDFVRERGGSFFRQYTLVSDGTIPARFYLHGKVERRAIGRIGDQIYFIASRHKETLWDFADALREYGFIDAIYITGGTTYCFCRDKDGIRHDIGNPEDYPHQRWQGIIPWLVFRNN